MKKRNEKLDLLYIAIFTGFAIIAAAFTIFADDPQTLQQCYDMCHTDLQCERCDSYFNQE